VGLARKLLILLLLIVLLLGGAALYVAVPINSDLNAAKRALSRDLGDLTRADLDAAHLHLTSADKRLASLPAGLLRLVPVARQNLNSVDGVVDAAIPVLTDARSLLVTREEIESPGLLDNGRINYGPVAALEEPLAELAQGLDALRDRLNARLSGWLLPFVWDEIADLAARADELAGVASRAATAARLAGPMLGSEGRRTYLVLLINNAELRGAGGILSAIGTLSIEAGDLRLGRFFYYVDLVTKPPQRVRSPRDFVRRFGRYRANTTVWVNATASPDVPEVARVAARLFELRTGIVTDGTLIVDPRGIAALMPPGASVAAPGGSNRRLAATDLPSYIYSESYSELGNQNARRRAILDLGTAAFRTILRRGLPDLDSLRPVGSAISGGHIRLVSFKEDEAAALTDLGVTGDLTSDAADSGLVTIQNFGADKLDFWIKRDLFHDCSIRVGSAVCTTRVALTNEAPEGLSRYVVQEKRSYAFYRGYLETYVPAAAELTGVTLDGRPARFYQEQEDGRKSLGTYVSIPRSERISLAVSYELPLTDDSYSLEISPQPLAHDARVSISLELPEDWVAYGPNGTASETYRHSGQLDRRVMVTAAPRQRSGIPALWDDLVRFWREPLF
jgi:hypothetical protein